jgi:hypothetical protein
MLESFHEETFARQLHTKFRLHTEPSRELDLELIEVSGGGEQKTPGFENFSLVFRGPLDGFLQQNTYQLEHPELGAFDLFIVPIRQDTEGFYYEAVFNRLTQ